MIRARTIEIDGTKVVLMALREFEVLRHQARTAMIKPTKTNRRGKAFRTAHRTNVTPRFPELDSNGHLPARAALRASIARDVIRARRAAGLSQEALAKLAGVRQATLAKIESTGLATSPATLDRIDRAIRTATGASNPRRPSSSKHRTTRP